MQCPVSLLRGEGILVSQLFLQEAELLFHPFVIHSFPPAEVTTLYTGCSHDNMVLSEEATLSIIL